MKAHQTLVTTPKLSLHNTDDQGITSHGDRPDSSIKKDNKEFIGIFIPNKTDGFYRHSQGGAEYHLKIIVQNPMEEDFENPNLWI